MKDLSKEELVKEVTYLVRSANLEKLVERYGNYESKLEIRETELLDRIADQKNSKKGEVKE